MPCKTYCVIVLCTVLIKYKYLSRIVLNVCTSLTFQQFIYWQVYNPRDIHDITWHITDISHAIQFTNKTPIRHLQIHCLSSWKVAMVCWHVECKLQLLFHKRLLTRYLPQNCVKSQCKIARNDERSSLYHNGNLINFIDQPWSVPCFQSRISFANFGINFAVLHT